MNPRDNDGPFPKNVFPPSVFPRRIFPWMGGDNADNPKSGTPDGFSKNDADNNKYGR